MDDEAPRMIVGSVDRGMAAVCNSTTGKVEKDIIYFNSDQLPMEIADLLFDRSRLFAGFLNGGVAMVSNVLSRSGMPQLRTFLGFHQGPVTKIASIPNQHNTLLSGGADGEVRVWNVSSGRSAAVCQGNTSPITSIVMDPKQFVAAGTMNGKIHVWVLDASTLKQSATPVSGLTIPNMTPDNVVSVSRTLDHFSSIQATGTRPIVNLLLDTTLSILISLCECKASDAGLLFAYGMLLLGQKLGYV
ncbi:WD40-repeat-containing domain protein [Chytridium lagenaria]|nr:WD40-repeat-containing domain protein [Chytridium lagenaria]